MGSFYSDLGDEGGQSRMAVFVAKVKNGRGNHIRVR